MNSDLMYATAAEDVVSPQGAAEMSTCLPRSQVESEFVKLKVRLLAERMAGTEDLALVTALCRASSEAASLANLTGYPSLVFPVLWDEKVVEAQAQMVRQERIRRRSHSLLGGWCHASCARSFKECRVHCWYGG